MISNNPVKVKTLAEQVRQQMLWLGLGLFITCLLLVFILALRATVLTTENLMMLEAQTLLRHTVKHPELPLPQDEALSAYRQWQDLPETLRQYFNNVPIPGEKVIEIPIQGSSGDNGYFYLLRYTHAGLGEIYTLSRHDTADVEAIFYTFFRSALAQAFWLTAIIFLVIFFLIRWLIRRTTEPLAMLSRWATTLTEQSQQSNKIAFPIEELNQLATQLREGVDKLQAYNEREHQFLKLTSHELRTPLAIIQASLDTLYLQSDESCQPAVQRALKASTNMRQLSSALLWLARESEDLVHKSPVSVRELCDQIIEDHHNLLSNRGVEVHTHITVDTLEIESEFLAIVISNLIRNAFQYSAAGAIEITISANGFGIANSINSESKTSDDNAKPGFGLGLQLVQRICQKLNWQFGFTMEESEAIITVFWKP